MVGDCTCEIIHITLHMGIWVKPTWGTCLLSCDMFGSRTAYRSVFPWSLAMSIAEVSFWGIHHEYLYIISQTVLIGNTLVDIVLYNRPYQRVWCLLQLWPAILQYLSGLPWQQRIQQSSQQSDIKAVKCDYQFYYTSELTFSQMSTFALDFISISTIS